MSLAADRIWLGLLACLLWTSFVVSPVVAIQLSLTTFTPGEGLLNLGLVALSEILVFSLATRWKLKISNYEASLVYQQTVRPEEYSAAPAITPVFLATAVESCEPRTQTPPRLGLAACCCWTVFVGIPVLTYHLESNQISPVEHIHAAVLFAAAEGLIYWLSERPWRRSVGGKRANDPRDPFAEEEPGSVP